MPITEQLRTATELEAAGASHALAQVLARKFEESAAAARDATLDAFATEMKLLRAELNSQFEKIEGRFEKIEGRFEKIDGRFEQIDGKLDTIEARLRAELHQSLRNSQAVVLSAIGVATAIIALLTHLWR
jgi:predicted transcriptional regulator